MSSHNGSSDHNVDHLPFVFIPILLISIEFVGKQTINSLFFITFSNLNPIPYIETNQNGANTISPTLTRLISFSYVSCYQGYQQANCLNLHLYYTITNKNELGKNEH